MKYIKYTLIIFTFFIVTISLYEAGLRLIFPKKSDFYFSRDVSDKYLPKHITSISSPTQGKRAEKEILSTYDENGFRINKYNCQSSDAKRLLIVGDSNIAAFFIEDGQDLGAILSRDLNGDRDCVRVDTFGVGGFGPDQSLFAIRDLTQRWHYDAVVFHVFADNDLGDIIRNNYPFVNGHLENTGYCYYEPDPFESFLVYRAVRKLLRLIHIYTNSQPFGRLIHSLGDDEKCAAPILNKHHAEPIDFLLSRAEFDWETYQKGLMQIFIDDRFDIEFACQLNAAATAVVEQRLQSIMQDYLELSRQRHFLPLVLIQPPEFDVTNNHPDMSNYLNTKCEKYDKTLLTRFIENLVPPQITTINLFERFDGCDKCYFSIEEMGDDDHWSPAGIEVAADEIARRLDAAHWP